MTYWTVTGGTEGGREGGMEGGREGGEKSKQGKYCIYI